MERFKGIAIVLLLLAAGVLSASEPKQASVLLQEGLYAEEVDGDLDAAIKIYQQIIAQSAAQRSHVAQAMYRLGMCHLKKQQEAEARAVFAKLVADYSDQARIIDKVKPLLEELSNGDPAALMPPDTLIYLEGGSPGKQIETILKMLEGTPFENPLAAIGGNRGNAQPGPEQILAGLLNPSMMAEFKKIRGVGVGFTGVAANHPPMIIVLYPGKSDALRGLIMAALSMVGKPGETIADMQTVLFHHGGAAAYDDTVMIFASPTAQTNGQLEWCVKQHKGVISEPSLASSNKSFAKISRKDRQANALTIWASVDEVFAGLEKVLPAGQMPQQFRMADQFVDLQSVDDLIASLSIEQDRIAVEANIAFKDGHQSTAYNLMRTPRISKAAFGAVPSEAVAIISAASPGANSAVAQMASAKLREKMGLNIGASLFDNIDQITLFALPPEGGQTFPGMPPIATSLGVVMTSDDPQQTRQILTDLLTAAKLIASPPADVSGGRYQIDLVNQLKIHCYADQTNKASILSLNPAVLDASVAAIRSGKSVTAAGPLNAPLRETAPDVSKLVLLNVAGALDFIESDESVKALLDQVADSCDKTTIRFRTQEQKNALNARVELTGLPPIAQVIGPITQLAKLKSEARERAWAESREAGMPASVAKASRSVTIDGTAEDLWSEAREYKIANVIYSPASSDADFSASYRALWDAENLYVMVDVADDVPKNDSDEFYFDDCVEVFIDADNSKSGGYGDNDYQYYFGWAEANPGMGESRHGKTDGAKFAVGRSDVGYRMEIKLPWSTLGTEPSAGTKIGLDVHVNDDDDGGDRDTKLTWWGKEDNAWQSPRALGTAELAGLVGWWKLDENEGDTAGDSAGADHTGKLAGGPRWRPSAGKINGALDFDGVDDYVDTGYTANLSAWTVAVWVKSPAAPSSQMQTGPVHREKNYQINWDHMLDAFRGGAGVCVGGQWYGAAFGDLRADTWYHMVATYDGENLKAYKDGVLITNNADPSGPPDAESESLKFGRHARDAAYFRGTIDDVRIYNYALGQDEIVAIYSGDR